MNNSSFPNLSLSTAGEEETNWDEECYYDQHQWLEAKLILMSVCGTIVAAFGIFGNLTTALILTRPAMRSPNNLYLTALAIFDTCLLITAVMIYSVEYIVEYMGNFQLYVAWLTYLRFCYAVSHISQTGSVYTTVAVTIERYLAVVHPSRSKLLCTKRGASVSILGVTCFAIIFNCTKFFELEIARRPNCSLFSAYSLAAGPLMSSYSYQVVYSLWLSNVVMVFLPFFTLLIFNSIIAWYIRRSLQRLSWAKRGEKRSELKEKSRDATRVLIIIVLIFLLCNFWGFVTTLMERIYGTRTLATSYPKFYAFSRESINFLAIINSSINFVIYIIFGKDFRKELIVVYGCRQGFTLMMPMEDKFAPWRSLRRRISMTRKATMRRRRQRSELRKTASESNLGPSSVRLLGKASPTDDPNDTIIPLEEHGVGAANGGLRRANGGVQLLRTEQSTALSNGSAKHLPQSSQVRFLSQAPQSRVPKTAYSLRQRPPFARQESSLSTASSDTHHTRRDPTAITAVLNHSSDSSPASPPRQRSELRRLLSYPRDRLKEPPDRSAQLDRSAQFDRSAQLEDPGEPQDHYVDPFEPSPRRYPTALAHFVHATQPLGVAQAPAEAEEEETVIWL